MGKKSHQGWARALESMVAEGTNLFAQWFPKGAAELEKQAREKAKAVQSYRQRRREAAALRPRKSRLLWLLPLPLIPAMVIALGGGNFTVFVSNACSYGLFLAAAVLTRHGFRQEVNLRQQRFQKTIRWPFKTMGGLTVALATGITAWAGAGHDIATSIGFGAGSFVAFVLLYGLDLYTQPVAVKDNVGNTQPVTEALQQAEQQILHIEQAAARINQPELNQRLARISALGRDILTEIARDPRDFRRARKFLNIYLDGAQRVVTGYAETHANLRNQTLEDNFRRVLVTIEEVFGQQYERLLENDLRDLDVDIEVLENQLKREGLH
ncbi:5-bromo-4-chloroindolyl phosphate hydrolysis family protein [Desulfopila inferna]|uniref:5-bromo-4-chloroindolyl phosphate hydrolysis family protein n=1 Tax=Desulfopila inferna TaxID=468528 RepID=UPI001964C3FB|nr:5-bromo-4-chloroindolyl phosphate hydrolysis family protein [Desulfopila inferna]MBM9605639.1 5-bromo-4-chloroindolyl phosphate hydrolysis family protein [Desulfopila inferna]